MPIYVALLRGINVGGHNKVAMSDLRDMFCALGHTGVKSLLQSGNLVFECAQRNATTLEQTLEAETAERLGVSPQYIIRSAKQWNEVIARNPFPKEAINDPSHLLVMFLKSAPSAKNVEVLAKANQGPEIIHCDGKELYIVYPAGIGTSKLTGTLIESKLGAKGTARNWNTVLKLKAQL
jgi:uncharacterized protein (DUF1697 family)